MKKQMTKTISAALALLLAVLLFATACGAAGELLRYLSGAQAPEGTSTEATEATETPPPTSPPSSNPSPSARGAFSFPYPFEAVDLYGNAVSDATLGEKEVFFVHLWATWCPPCLAEMPDFEKLTQSYSDRVGFLALLTDYGENLSGAIDIVQQANIPDTFVMIDAYLPGVSEIYDLLESGYVPTTVLISRDGVGEQLIGSYGTGYAQHIDALLAVSTAEDAQSSPPEPSPQKSGPHPYAVELKQLIDNTSGELTAVLFDFDLDGVPEMFVLEEEEYMRIYYLDGDDLKSWTVESCGTIWYRARVYISSSGELVVDHVDNHGGTYYIYGCDGGHMRNMRRVAYLSSYADAGGEEYWVDGEMVSESKWDARLGEMDVDFDRAKLVFRTWTDFIDPVGIYPISDNEQILAMTTP